MHRITEKIVKNVCIPEDLGRVSCSIKQMEGELRTELEKMLTEICNLGRDMTSSQIAGVLGLTRGRKRHD